MAWIELHQALPTHRKTLALADALNIDPVQAVGHLACFWLWALDNAPNGDLGDVTARTVARAAGWKKSPERFADALHAAGFLDGTQIHNWGDYAGRLVEKRAANKERMRTARAAKGTPPTPPTDGPRATHVQRTTDARAGATVPNPTVPDLTTPNGVVGATTREAIPKPKPKHPPVDDEYIEGLVVEFGPWARTSIAKALNHKALNSAIDQRKYVRTWVAGDAEKRHGIVPIHVNGHAAPAPKPAVDPAFLKYRSPA